jgi:succinoglycan biosynthesis transport protein ExoP
VSNATAVRDTTIIDIKADHTNPQMAASIANMLVTVLIEQNEKIQSGRYVLMEESLNAQKTQMEQQIEILQSQIDQASIKTINEQKQWLQDQIKGLEKEADTLPNEIAALSNASTLEQRNNLGQKRARLDQVKLLLPLYQKSYTNLVVYGTQVDAAKGTANSQLSLLTSTQTLYQRIYVDLLSRLESTRLASMQNTPNVVPIMVAAAPDGPIRPRPLLNSVLAGMAGLLLSAGILFLNEYLDNTIKASDEIENIYGLSAIGFISEMENKATDETGIYVAKQPRAPITEAFRSLRTNIEFSAINKPIKTILVTSPEPGTGKTTIAANLAIIYAQKGRRVLLVDADLRQPHLHQAMNLPNRIGLTDLLLENQKIQSVCNQVEGINLVEVITTGSLPPNPAELLDSIKMTTILAELGKNKDLIIIDSPPSVVADAQVLAAKVDAVLLVIQPGKTQKNGLKTTIEIFKRANAHVIGIVVNFISRERGDYYSQYHYQGYEYAPSAKSKEGTKNNSLEANIKSVKNSFLNRSKSNKKESSAHL